jgi:hypothetical protein
LVAWWRAEHVQGIVIGGLAVALLGRPRVTRDVDALVIMDQHFTNKARRCSPA